jgi:hypothetical protein
MSKIIFLVIVAGLAVVVITAINTNVVNARQQIEFIQISVLAEHQADYGVKEQVIAIPAVSVDIIEDAAQDFQAQSSVRVITYTSLPTKEPTPPEEGSGSVDETRHNNGQGNGSEKDKRKNKEKEREKEKEKDKGGNSGGGNDKEKSNENKSEKKE